MSLYPIAYTYEADHHCPECASERFGDSLDTAEDNEGNSVGAVFSTDEWFQVDGSCETLNCGDCGEELATAHNDPHSEDCPEYEAPDFWELLETPPTGCAAVADLWSWSTNYDAGKGPATLFLDLIGLTQEEYGQAYYDLDNASLGYLEIEKLTAALAEYLASPIVIRSFVSTLLNAEVRS